MPKHSYQLVNPQIGGTFKDTYDAKSPIEASESMWKNLSKHIVNHVPKFMFTMRNITNNKLYHFKVNEKKSDSSYVITQINDGKISGSKKDFDNFLKQVDVFDNKSQKGGNLGKKVKRKRYDDSSSSSSEDYPDVKRTSPIGVFHYNAHMYYTPTDVIVETVNSTLNPTLAVSYVPVFKQPLEPFVVLW